MNQENNKLGQGLSPKEAQKFLYGSLVLFLAAGGLSAYLHYAHPSPPQCEEVHYHLNGSTRDRETDIKQQEVYLQGMEALAAADEVITNEEDKILVAEQDALADKKELYNLCEPSVPTRGAELLLIPFATIGGMLTVLSAGKQIFRAHE